MFKRWEQKGSTHSNFLEQNLDNEDLEWFMKDRKVKKLLD